MTPKEKASQLLDDMIVDFNIDKWQSKQCALMLVDEVLEALTDYPYGVQNLYHQEYWKDIKQELNKL